MNDTRKPPMTAVTIYLRPGCPYCDRAKSLLARKGVPFTAVDVWQERERRPASGTSAVATSCMRSTVPASSTRCWPRR